MEPSEGVHRDQQGSDNSLRWSGKWTDEAFHNIRGEDQFVLSLALKALNVKVLWSLSSNKRFKKKTPKICHCENIGWNFPFTVTFWLERSWYAWRIIIPGWWCWCESAPKLAEIVAVSRQWHTHVQSYLLSTCCDLPTIQECEQLVSVLWTITAVEQDEDSKQGTTQSRITNPSPDHLNYNQILPHAWNRWKIYIVVKKCFLDPVAFVVMKKNTSVGFKI